MAKEMVIVLDFGGQYNQLIARRVRECNVYCEVLPYTKTLDEIKALNPKGIIFTGGPNSVYDETSPHYEKAIFELGIPILGICYGSQLMAYTLGGEVATAPVSEYGHTDVEVYNFCPFPRRCRYNRLLDESYRLYQGSTGRLPYYSPYTCLPCCSYGMC